MPNSDPDRNRAIDRFVDSQLGSDDWRDYATLRSTSPEMYRKTVATLGKILAKKLTIQIDARLASEEMYADF